MLVRPQPEELRVTLCFAPPTERKLPIMIDERFIANWFNYHAPSKDQQVNYETIRAHAREFAHILNNLVPDGADKTTALRKLREVVMTANAAIACQEEHDRIAGTSTMDLAPARKTATTTPVAGGGGSSSPYQTTTGFGGGGGSASARTPQGTSLDNLVSSFAAGRRRR